MRRSERFVLSWVQLYTRLVPVADAERRLAELRSHLHEEWAAARPGRRIVADAWLGMHQDLAWSNDVRRHAGESPLPYLLVSSVEAATAAAVACIAVSFVLGCFAAWRMVELLSWVCYGVALSLLCTSLLLAAGRQLTRRRTLSSC